MKIVYFIRKRPLEKNELHLIVEEKEEEEKEKYNLEDLEEIKDLEEDTKNLILFNDKEGKSHLLPYLSTVITKYEELEVKCANINCIHDNELNCRKCPYINHGKLNPGEFKILKPKDKRSEGGK